MNHDNIQTNSNVTTQDFISPAELADRWRMSRSGAVRLIRAAGIRSYQLGRKTRGTLRFSLGDVIAYEKTVAEDPSSSRNETATLAALPAVRCP